MPLTGQGGTPFEGACNFRLDTINSISASTPDSKNWKIMGGGTIGGGIWNTQTIPNLDSKFPRAKSTSGGSGGGNTSHNHGLNVSDEIHSSPCSGTGEYLVTTSYTNNASEGDPAYYDLEIWLRIK